MTDAIQKAREALEAARDAIALHRAFEAVPADRGGHFGPKGKALSAWREAEAFAEGCVSRALAALDAETEVKVRELEWSGQSWGYIGPLYESETMLGTYTVEEYGAGNWCTYFNRAKFGDTHATEEAAKDAVQENYERRIRSELVPPEARS